MRERRLLGQLDGLGEPAAVTGAWMRFSPDGRTIAISAGPRTSLWDVASRRRLPDLHDPSHLIGHVQAFSPDGRTLAVAVDQDGTEHTRAWDLTRRSMTGAFPIEDRRVLTFVADDRVLTSGAEIVDLASGRRTPLAGTGPFAGDVVALSADRRLVAVGEEGQIGIWDTATGRAARLCVTYAPGLPPASRAVTPPRSGSLPLETCWPRPRPVRSGCGTPPPGSRSGRRSPGPRVPDRWPSARTARCTRPAASVTC
ncbi:hypothetical protein ACFQ0B_01170 [Nonomuraea thailandensis]